MEWTFITGLCVAAWISKRVNSVEEIPWKEIPLPARCLGPVRRENLWNPSSIGLTCIPHIVVMAAGWTFWICFSNLNASPLCVASTGKPTAKHALMFYWFLLHLPSSVTSYSTFKMVSCLVQPWKTPNIWQKVQCFIFLATDLSLYLTFLYILRQHRVKQIGALSR